MTIPFVLQFWGVQVLLIAIFVQIHFHLPHPQKTRCYQGCNLCCTLLYFSRYVRHCSQISYGVLQYATNLFTTKLGGGFGVVYRGTVVSNQYSKAEVAVKVLDGHSRHGDKQFQTVKFCFNMID